MELCAENEYVTLFRSWWNHNGNSLRISANCKQSWIILLRVQNVAEAFRCWNMKCWSILMEVADFVGMWSHLFSALSNVLLCLFWCIIQSLCYLLFTFDFRVFWTVLYFSLCEASQGHSNWLQDAKGGWVHWFLGFLILWPLLYFFYWQTGLTHMIFLLCNDNWASQGSSFYLWMLIRVYGSLVFEFPTVTHIMFLLCTDKWGSQGSSCWFQDAKKGVLFIDFPPVLQLQLKRFEYDFVRDTMVKVSAKHTLRPYHLDFLD